MLFPLFRANQYRSSIKDTWQNLKRSFINYININILFEMDRKQVLTVRCNVLIRINLYKKNLWFRFQPTIDLARYSTSDGFNFEEEFIVRRERKISLDDERGRSRIQSSVRLRRIGCRCNGRFGKEMENCATTVSLRGWFRARNSVSVLPFTVRFNLEGSPPARGRWETPPCPSFPLPFRSRVNNRV